MLKEPLFIEPVFKERIWGGKALAEVFHYDIPSERTGECWAVSGHSNGQTVVKNGEYKGLTLSELWENHRDLFGNHSSDTFPLLIKILDANADLSVQVHPDDEYGRKYESGELGKTECWYIIDCKEDAEMIFGHHASSKEELRAMIDRGEWDQLLRRVKIQPGDFFYVPSGTIHALGEGTLVLETQQTSDTTYRVYDYDRVDQEGNKRELHLEKAIDVTTVPHVDREPTYHVKTVESAEITTFVECEYFTVQKWSIDGKASFEQNETFQIISVINGEGELSAGGQTFTVQKGDHFILPYEFGTFSFQGKLHMIVSYV
ncbi:mannose-6-phosphate isomerase, class I [Melghirimyces algeriensis]|uniref:Mannose-6-phosphate isomerase n=1 Tax=Melghirimyces algeriensis TaxID=910412 RepID=A0A521FHH5_9BACL|nr:mannose-6-phosphate isomerase, class I [Melghirimyces algeriensis]SMO95667.1 mannose-6-phosphate isomerase, type 1 [Melghirimyces algeriensis]